jgi:uncharacterized protein (DUF169 family)
MKKPLPGMRGIQRALRQARLYGHLVGRNGRLYYPGGCEPLCGVQAAKDLVRSGRLIHREGKYEITPEGQRAFESGGLRELA